MKSFYREEEKILSVPDELKTGELEELELVDCLILESVLLEILEINSKLSILNLVTIYFDEESFEKESPIEEIPGFLFGFPNIKHLDLGENAIKSIPPEINMLHELKSLLVEKNQLDHLSFPIILPSGLEYLDISGNKIGELPKSVYSLFKLKTLHCRHLKLKIFELEQGDLVNLENLDFSYSNIQLIGSGLAGLGSLRVLNLNTCELKTFPEGVFEMDSLEEINLQNCQVISDHINTLMNSYKLKKLNLNKIKFESLSLSRLDNLEHLILKECNLKSLEIEKNSLQNLRYIDLDNNELAALPNSFYQLKSLESIVLNNNKINGISSGIGELIKLRSLRLFKNKMTYLPENFGDLDQLESLNLGQNALREIPGLEKLKKLKWIDISGCRELEDIDDILDRLSFLPNLSTISLQWLDVKKLPDRFKYSNSLKRINIGRTSLMDKERIDFQNKFPNVYLWMISQRNN